MPESISLKEIAFSTSLFNPRFDAKIREYSYLFTPFCIPFSLKKYILPISFVPNHYRFLRFANLISGTHNFSNLIINSSSLKSTYRTIYSVNLDEILLTQLFDSAPHIKCFRFRVSANSFLHALIRYLVSAYILFEENKLTLSEISYLLLDEEYRIKIMPAPAYALTLTNVVY